MRKDNLRVLVLGNGGREHALCYALSKSPLLNRLYCAPGNTGTQQLADSLNIDPCDIEQVRDMCEIYQIDFVVVGPEAPLSAGIVDGLTALGIPAFGPIQAAAQLESSKAFTKDLAQEYGIPTARYAVFTNTDDAKAYVKDHPLPIVIKADGLAAGKGVVIAQTLDEAHEALDDMLNKGSFGGAGSAVVIEEFLEGEEVSFFALCDGKNIQVLPSAQDHKRVYDGDQGPNTGGMGAYSPAPLMTDALAQETVDTIIMPTVKAMIDKGTPYKGVLYAGLMITHKGPFLIEYNARFGDPECQVLMMRLESDLLEALIACAEGTLDQVSLKWSEDPALLVVMAAKGYPATYETGTVIQGIDRAETTGAVVFHAGTSRHNGEIVAHGGRVLGVAARGLTVSEAQKKAYEAISHIQWEDGFYRKDIGWRAIQRERKH
jgi:phosphoribosylamine---glycine ligase